MKVKKLANIINESIGKGKIFMLIDSVGNATIYAKDGNGIKFSFKKLDKRTPMWKAYLKERSKNGY